MDLIHSTTDILILAGALCLFVIAVVIAVVGFQMGYILKDIARITHRVDRASGRLENYIFAPLDFLEKNIGDASHIKKIIRQLFQ